MTSDPRHAPLPALDDFLQSAERRAFKRTVFAVRDTDAALDIVQDAMIRLSQSYADRPEGEWPKLFARILSNATLDWFRRQKVRNAIFVNLSEFSSDSSEEDKAPFDLLTALRIDEAGTEGPEDIASRMQTLTLIEEAVHQLPPRQREAFLLRYWEELDVAETADVMGCSQGSVKTHCSRAVQALAKALHSHGIAL